MNTLFESAGVAVSIIIFVIWSLVWKGMALWRAARLGQKKWFIALLVINTAGLLEILYLYGIAPKNNKS